MSKFTKQREESRRQFGKEYPDRNAPSLNNEEHIMGHTVVGNMDISKFTLGTAQLGPNYGIANTNGKPDYQKWLLAINN